MLLFPDYFYVDGALAGLDSRSNVMPIEAYNAALLSANLGTAELPEKFRSWFRFNESYLLHYHLQEGRASVRGYEGSHVLDFLFVDIDAEDKSNPLESARARLLQFLEIAGKHFDLNRLFYFFSGGKGFHIYIPSSLFLPEPNEQNYAIARTFLEKLFPDWVKPGGIIDAQNYNLNRMVREVLTRKQTQDQWTGYKNPLNQEHLTLLETSAEFIKEYCNTPASWPQLSEHLTGELYWQGQSDDKLVALWKECQEIKHKEKHGVTLKPAGIGFSRPGSVTTEMPQCVANMLDAWNNGTIPAGTRDTTLAILAAYFKNLFPNYYGLLGAVKGVWEGAVRHGLETGVTEQNVERIVRSTLNGNYNTGCGSESSYGLMCLKFCNAQGKKELCPKHKVADDGEGTKWVSADTALAIAEADLRLGESPIRWGLPVWDNLIRGHRPGDIIVLQGEAQTGKTILMIKWLLQNLENFKRRNEIIFVMSPEGSIADLTQRIMLQKGRYSWDELYQHGTNGGFPKAVRSIFEDYKETFKIGKASGYTVQQIGQDIDKIEQKYGRKVGNLCFDGAILASAAGGSEKDLAMQFESLIQSKQIIGFLNVHMSSKTQNAAYESKTRNVSRSAARGYGTTLWYILATFMGSLDAHPEFNGIINFSIDKAKRIFHGDSNGKKKDVLPSFYLLLDDYRYNIYAKEDIERMPPAEITKYDSALALMGLAEAKRNDSPARSL